MMIYFGGSVVKNLPGNAEDTGDSGLVPGLGKSPGERNGNPLQYSFLGNPMNRGASGYGVSNYTSMELERVEHDYAHPLIRVSAILHDYI